MKQKTYEERFDDMVKFIKQRGGYNINDVINHCPIEWQEGDNLLGKRWTQQTMDDLKKIVLELIALGALGEEKIYGDKNPTKHEFTKLSELGYAEYMKQLNAGKVDETEFRKMQKDLLALQIKKLEYEASIQEQADSIRNLQENELKYKEDIRDQEDRIRGYKERESKHKEEMQGLEDQLKIISLIRNYGWVIGAAFAAGAAIVAWLNIGC